MCLDAYGVQLMEKFPKRHSVKRLGEIEYSDVDLSSLVDVEVGNSDTCFTRVASVEFMIERRQDIASINVDQELVTHYVFYNLVEER